MFTSEPEQDYQQDVVFKFILFEGELCPEANKEENKVPAVKSYCFKVYTEN